MSHQPQGQELQGILDSIDAINRNIKQIDEELSREARKEKSRLEEEHETWAPLILDAKSGLEQGEATVEEVASLEKEEHTSRLAIRKEFQQRLTKLQENKQALGVELARRFASLSPSKKLKDDNLLDIFTLFIEKQGDPWVLAHTCSQWRGIVMNTHQLWSGIYVSTNIDDEVVRRRNGKEVCNSAVRLERALARVRDAPIDLDIMLNWSHTSLDLDTTEKMIIMVSNYSQQWRTLHLENSEKVIPANHRFPSNLFQYGLPSLRTVSFHMENYDSTRPSLGLLPFAGLLTVIEQTSRDLQSVHFHGYGRSDPVNVNYGLPEVIEDLTLIPADPRLIWQAYDQFLQVRPAITRISRRYVPFIHQAAPLSQENEVLRPDIGTVDLLPTDRRLAIYPSLPQGLHPLHLNKLHVLDIVAQHGLNLTSPLRLYHVRQLSVYSNDLDGLRHLDAPGLKNLRVMLLAKEQRMVRASQVALQEMWDRQRPGLKELRLVGVGVDYDLLATISSKSVELRRILLHDVTFEAPGALRGLADKLQSHQLEKVEVTYHDMLGPTRAASLGDDLRQLVNLREISGCPLKHATLEHGSEKEEFVQ